MVMVELTLGACDDRYKNAIESDADDQLIIRVPFTGSVKLKSILLRSGPEDQTPAKIALVRQACCYFSL